MIQDPFIKINLEEKVKFELCVFLKTLLEVTMSDRIGIIIAASTLIFSFILFFLQNGELIGSFAAAVLATGLAWSSYIVLAWMYTAAKNK